MIFGNNIKKKNGSDFNTLGFVQIHLPRKQRLINRKVHRHVANEGMDSYR